MEAQLHPEQQSRIAIDRMLTEAGWIVQDYRGIDLTAGLGIAAREVPTKSGPVDYMLFVDEKATGTVEAKKEGTPLLGIEPQTRRYIEGFKELLKDRAVPHWGPDEEPLPFHYQGTGAETVFTNLRDPIARPRDVFSFHRPETLQAWAREDNSSLDRIQKMPELDKSGLRQAQVVGIENLEQSLGNAKPKALINMTMGSGKTYVAVAEAYRLLRYAGSRRVLFLVDRINLGQQAYAEFADYVTPDDGRKFTELYNVQLLRSNKIDPAAKVVITTIQRLYSILRGEQELEQEEEERSTFEVAPAEPLPPVEYRSDVPDRVLRRWLRRRMPPLDLRPLGPGPRLLRHVSDRSDGNGRTHRARLLRRERRHRIQARAGRRGRSQRPLHDVSDQERSHGGRGQDRPGDWVGVRTPRSSKPDRKQLEDELTYDKATLDRAVVNPAQIRAVVREFKDKVCTEIFPGRPEVPKTVFFCKNESPRRGRAEGHPRGVQSWFGLRAEDHLQDRGRPPRTTSRTSGPIRSSASPFPSIRSRRAPTSAPWNVSSSCAWSAPAPCSNR